MTLPCCQRRTCRLPQPQQRAPGKPPMATCRRLSVRGSDGEKNILVCPSTKYILFVGGLLINVVYPGKRRSSGGKEYLHCCDACTALKGRKHAENRAARLEYEQLQRPTTPVAGSVGIAKHHQQEHGFAFLQPTMVVGFTERI